MMTDIEKNRRLAELERENSRLREREAELTKENEDAKFWAEEQAKGLNAAADRNAELSSELTKANHNILSLTEQVEKLKLQLDSTQRDYVYYKLEYDALCERTREPTSNELSELSRLREREKELVEALKARIEWVKHSKADAERYNDWFKPEVMALQEIDALESLLSKFEVPNQS